MTVLGHRLRSAAVVAVVVVLAACGSADSESANDDGATTSPHADTDAGADYCVEVRDLMTVLDSGGSVSDYEAALGRVGDASPPDHQEAWVLLLTLSSEPFDYENFNPAVDALDDISDDLDVTCSGTEWLIVDDSGRIRQLQPG